MKITRKRQRNPEKWGKNVVKAAVNAGLEYKSTTTKKIVAARTMQRTCGPGCRFKCEEKVTEDTRKNSFYGFWHIQEHARQYDFILRHVTEKATKDPTKGKRIHARVYSISDRTKNITVCQTMILNTLDNSK